jgi:four helix bundle protein
MSFHENKLWQEAFVVLMDTHEAFEGDFDEKEEEIVEQVLTSATNLSAKIADGLSRIDRRMAGQILMDAVGLVAIVRTHLAVAWGRGLLTDEIFRTLDGKFDGLGIALQHAR